MPKRSKHLISEHESMEQSLNTVDLVRIAVDLAYLEEIDVRSLSFLLYANAPRTKKAQERAESNLR